MYDWTRTRGDSKKTLQRIGCCGELWLHTSSRDMAHKKKNTRPILTAKEFILNLNKSQTNDMSAHIFFEKIYLLQEILYSDRKKYINSTLRLEIKIVNCHKHYILCIIYKYRLKIYFSRKKKMKWKLILTTLLKFMCRFSSMFPNYVIAQFNVPELHQLWNPINISGLPDGDQQKPYKYLCGLKKPQ